MEERLSRVKGALRTIIAVEEDGYCKRNVVEALDIINHLEKELCQLKYDSEQKLIKVGQHILNTSEECGGGVLFYNRMRKYASELMEGNNDAR